MLNFNLSLLVYIMSFFIISCTSTKSTLNEDELIIEVNNFIDYTQELRENSIKAYNVSRFMAGNRTFISISTNNPFRDVSYSDTLVNRYYNPQFGILEKTIIPTESLLSGYRIQQNIIVCYYNFPNLKNLHSIEDVPIKFKKLRSSEKIDDVGGYVLGVVYEVKNGNLSVAFTDTGYTIKDYEEFIQTRSP